MRLSKSKIQGYEMCSWKFKLQEIDKIKEPPTPFGIYAKEGQDFHKATEEYFAKVNPFKKIYSLNEAKKVMNCKEEYAENFILKFVKPILLNSKSEPKYYFPFLSEEKIYNSEYDFAGIVDAVFINSKDDEYIIVDWKSGKMPSKKKMREELAYYKLLLDESGMLEKPVKYYAMFFAKVGKLFFEEADDKIVEEVKNKIKDVREKIKNEEFEKNNKGCYFCGYKLTGICDVQE